MQLMGKSHTLVAPKCSSPMAKTIVHLTLSLLIDEKLSPFTLNGTYSYLSTLSYNISTKPYTLSQQLYTAIVSPTLSLLTTLQNSPIPLENYTLLLSISAPHKLGSSCTLTGGFLVMCETRKFMAISSQLTYSSTLSLIACGIMWEYMLA